jgi:hypothetical protein
MARGTRGKRGGRATQNVRVLDDYAGNDSGRIERMIGDVQNSQAQARILCSDVYTVNVPAVTTGALIAASQVQVTDDFTSMAAQYETFRVRAIRFDIYDINPSLSAVGFFGTFHASYLSNAQPTYTSAAVVDSVDGQLVPPGTGKLSLTWMAKGTREMGFNSTTAPVQDFGGLRYSINGQVTTGAKYQVYFKALVDFRGKL